MKLSGHETRSVFDRYNVVSDGDQRDAARRLGHTGGHTSPSLVLGGGETKSVDVNIQAPKIAEAPSAPSLPAAE